MTARDISQIGQYCIIWSPNDLAKLSAAYMPTCNDWVWRSGYATLQFLRVRDLGDHNFGWAARHRERISTYSAIGVERRYKALSKFIKKSYVNSVVQWSSGSTLSFLSFQQLLPDRRTLANPTARFGWGLWQ